MLMRPTVETSRDPLRVGALPSITEMELDYRTSSGSERQCRQAAVYYLVLGTLMVLLFSLGLRIFAVYTSSPLFLALAALLGVIWAAWSYITTQSAYAALIRLCFGPGLWMLSVASTTGWHAVLLLWAAIISLNLAHGITRHYAAWMHANPFLERTTRHAWWRHWRTSDWPEHLLEFLYYGAAPADLPVDPVERGETVERARYGLGFAVVLLAFVFAALVLILHGAPLTRGTWAVLAFLSVVVPFGLINALRYEPRPSIGVVLRSFGEAVISWLAYNDHDTRAPGVFQSPFGFAGRRRRTFRAGMFCTAIVVLPAAWYFPIGIFVFGPAPWVRAAAEPWPWDSWFERPGSRPQGTMNRPAPVKRGAASSLLTEDSIRRRENVARQRQEDWRANLHSAARNLNGRPEASLWVYARGLTNFDWRIIGSIVLAFIACACTPPLLLLATCFAIGSRVLVHHRVTLEDPGLYQMNPRPSLWHAYVHRLAASAHSAPDELGRPVRERDHLLVGFSLNGDYPVLIHEPIMREHAHVTGDSGSHKTSLALAPLIAQLVGRPKTSVVVLDLKGDPTLFEATRIAVDDANAARQGRPIRLQWFTNMQDQSTHVFNMFLQTHMRNAGPHQKMEILLKSLGLEHGEGYGPSYFSSIHRAMLGAILKDCPEADSFRQLHRYVTDVLPNRTRDLHLSRDMLEQSMHLFNVIGSLASFDALNVTRDDALPSVVLDRCIDMSHIVRRPSVVYFKMHSLVEEASVREIAKLAMFSLLTAATQRGPSDHTVYLVIDEFQQLISRDMEIILRQARSHGIPTILANQTLSDLKDNQVDLIPVVQANTRFRQIFSASDVAHQKMLIEGSGEALYHMLSWGMNETLDTIVAKNDETVFNVKEEIGPRLRRNDILAASSQEMHSLVQVTRDGGLSQFGGFLFPMRSLYHITADEYKRREHTPWPSAKHHPGTIVPPLRPAADSDAPPKQSGAPKPNPARPVSAPSSAPGTKTDLLSEVERQIDQL